MMRTLLLLNTTQNKLQYEENVYDSSSPLKALQLLRMAQLLNDNLHNEQAVQARSPIGRHTDFRNSTSTVITEAVVEEDDDDEVLRDDDVLAEMQTAIEVGHGRLEEISDSVIEIEETEILDDDEEEEAAAAGEDLAILSPSQITLSFASKSADGVDHLDMMDEDLTERDIAEMDLDDMPTLSRQVSFGAIPSLYHSDSYYESEEDDHTEDSLDCDEAVRSFLHTHDKYITHPAAGLLEKKLVADSAPLLNHELSPI